VQLRQTLALWTLASRLPAERPLLETNGDILWIQQCCSGVRCERRRRRKVKYTPKKHELLFWFQLIRPIRPHELLSWWGVPPSVCLSLCPFSNISHKLLLLPQFWTDFSFCLFYLITLLKGHIASTWIILITVYKWPMHQPEIWRCILLTAHTTPETRMG